MSRVIPAYRSASFHQNNQYFIGSVIFFIGACLPDGCLFGLPDVHPPSGLFAICMGIVVNTTSKGGQQHEYSYGRELDFSETSNSGS